MLMIKVPDADHQRQRVKGLDNTKRQRVKGLGINSQVPASSGKGNFLLLDHTSFFKVSEVREKDGFLSLHFALTAG